jgi:hypothetical protein
MHYSALALDTQAADPRVHSVAPADYRDYLDQMNNSQVADRLDCLPVAPVAAIQDTNTAEEPVTPAVAAVRRFSLVSLLLQNWCLLYGVAGIESKPGTHLGYPARLA